MTFEKSCGAVVFRNERKDGVLKRYVLMIKHSIHGHHSFPKGHVEAGETEMRTAEREVFEETAVKINIVDKFRHPVYYRPRPGAKKEVVYFVALTDQIDTSPAKGETVLAQWIPIEEASGLLAHENDRRVLSHALEYLKVKNG